MLDAYPDWRIPAHVITTVPTADRQKATVRVRIGFEELDPRILPDMGVKVSFLSERQPDERRGAAQAAAAGAEGARCAPWTGRRSSSWCSDERAERRAVTVGATDGDQVEVVSGLTAGERVVVEGAATLSGRRQGDGEGALNEHAGVKSGICTRSTIAAASGSMSSRASRSTSRRATSSR